MRKFKPYTLLRGTTKNTPDLMLFTNQHRKAKVLFGLSDIVLTVLAFEAAYQTRIALNFEHVFFLLVPVKALVLGYCVITFLLVGRWLNVHGKLDSGEPRVVFLDSFRQSVYGALCLIVFEFVLRLQLSRSFLLLFAFYSWVFLLIFRLLAGSLAGVVRKEFGALRHVLIVGIGQRARRLGEALERSAEHGVRLEGFVAYEPDPGAAEIKLNSTYRVYPIRELPSLLREKVVDEILFVVGSAHLPELEETFLLCDEEGVRTRVAIDFFPHVHSDVHLERLGATPLLTFSAAPDDEIRMLAKRTMDVVLASIGLLLALPFMAIIALAIRMTSPGPAIFRQERCGLNGRRFVFYKFRSMVLDAEARKAEVMHLSRRDLATKIPNDPRLTPIGRFLRKFSIDELPQFVNVIRGDMSLVGPRPAVPSEVEQYKLWQRRRLRMRPGLTCLWALNGRDHVDFETWMKMDMQYIDNWSLGLDWKILLGTIPRVLVGKGAH